MSKKEEIDVGRRDFFKKAGLGAGAATIAVTASQAGAVEAVAPQKKSAGYSETDHVRKFYDLARF
ncbi:twin-arginine translocation signal domain-containing protein [Pelagibius litoralis]|uniref:Twin-arginine translocation signal domain-containing protein n=1 Tax=Pelagibius litoralis TaxID=374515 RepID=A0A967EY16_9PROT|nr:twin-arginine translocation signal domain-containing protein [Pelagibius litoralis]NIA69514.1 twin-arginine translocation signal domain-containing protein [Pelagibius litoralis]